MTLYLIAISCFNYVMGTSASSKGKSTLDRPGWCLTPNGEFLVLVISSLSVFINLALIPLGFIYYAWYAPILGVAIGTALSFAVVSWNLALIAFLTGAVCIVLILAT
jgi:hypothetical protein